jgi:cbb3-type cytochrome oxidase subunit 1
MFNDRELDSFLGLVAIIVTGCYPLAGYIYGKEYAELEWPVDIAI